MTQNEQKAAGQAQVADEKANVARADRGMATVQDLLVSDATNEHVRAEVLVGAAGDALLRENEDDAQKGNEDVEHEHEAGQEHGQVVLVGEKVDLVAHLEQNADAVLDEGSDEEHAGQKRQIRGHSLAEFAHCRKCARHGFLQRGRPRLHGEGNSRSGLEHAQTSFARGRRKVGGR